MDEAFFNYSIFRYIAISSTPLTTVMERLRYLYAIMAVGSRISNTGQSIVRLLCSCMSRFSITNAVKIQTGTKDSHFMTTSGKRKFRTRMNGRILGMTVTKAESAMTASIVLFILIYLAPPRVTRL